MTYDLSGLPDPRLDTQFYRGVALKRLLAWAIDAFIILSISFGVVMLTFGIAAFFWFFVTLLISFSYRSIMISRSSATLGMRALGIELRNSNGDKLDGSQAIWHVVLYLFMLSFFVFGLISMVMMVMTARGQGLHDVFLGTTAINVPDD